jgi:hypothetical protein
LNVVELLLILRALGITVPAFPAIMEMDIDRQELWKAFAGAKTGPRQRFSLAQLVHFGLVLCGSPG